jgi:hypothetical protein
MPDRSPSRRTVLAVAFIVGGALLALAALVGLAPGPGGDIARVLRVLGDLAVAAAFVVLAIDLPALVIRIASIVAAAGWLLFAVGELAGLPGQLGTVAQLAAAGGGLVAAVFIRSTRAFPALAALVFLIATAIYAALVLLLILGVDVRGIGLVLGLAFAAGLITTGALLVTRPRPVP